MAMPPNAAGPAGSTPNAAGNTGGSTFPSAGGFAPPNGYPNTRTQLGEYELLEKLGEGGMGSVYRAKHIRLGRIVALKALSPTHLKDRRALVRFDREMRAVGVVDHPNVVRAMDAREIEGTRFLVMEFVDGMELSDVIRCLGPLAVADAAELVRQASAGLQAAHEHGLVHRDIKPSNLMLTRLGVLKLCDLGLARFAMDLGEEEVTGTGQAMGTPDYMAPEQITDSRRVDIRADIYSLGCTFYKFLTGWAPFTGPEFRTAVQKMMAHTDKAPRPIGVIRKDVHPDLVAVIDRMMAKDPKRRYATPMEVVVALQPFTMGTNLPALYQRAETMMSQGSGSQPDFPRPQGSAPGSSTGPPRSGMHKLKAFLYRHRTVIFVTVGSMLGVMMAHLLVWFMTPEPSAPKLSGPESTAVQPATPAEAPMQPAASQPQAEEEKQGEDPAESDAAEESAAANK